MKEFQQVSKISRKYTHIEHGGVPIKEKCIRVFASKNSKDLGVTKISERTGNPEKIANSPDNCFIVNDDVNNMKCPKHLDKDWYIDKAKKRLRDFGVNI